MCWGGLARPRRVPKAKPYSPDSPQNRMSILKGPGPQRSPLSWSGPGIGPRGPSQVARVRKTGRRHDLRDQPAGCGRCSSHVVHAPLHHVPARGLTDLLGKVGVDVLHDSGQPSADRSELAGAASPLSTRLPRRARQRGRDIRHVSGQPGPLAAQLGTLQAASDAKLINDLLLVTEWKGSSR